jgi:predicted RNA-binding protein Jag
MIEQLSSLLSFEPTGRAIIHDKCNFLGMASISQGKNEKRYIIVYPKHLFKDK